jgi:hypothetical protein
VKALIVYDLARLHRRGWRIGDLLDQLEKNDIDLVFTRPGYEMETKTRTGKFIAQIRAMFDEDYAEQVSERTIAAVEFLRAQGKSVGASPFGTQRDGEGFLEPSPRGAWLLPDGRFVKGKPDQPPQEGAIWRGYFDCARYILELFAENKMGMDKIAYRLNTEKCGCANRTVPADIIEAEVGRLLKLLMVREEALDYLTELAIQSEHGLIADDEVNLEEQKQEAIALCQRRIDAAAHHPRRISAAGRGQRTGNRSLGSAHDRNRAESPGIVVVPGCGQPYQPPVGESRR